MGQLRHPRADELSLTQVLAALSDPIRLGIVKALAEAGGERPWGEFEVGAGVGPSTLSHHMKTLRLAGLIVHRKQGTRCYVALRPDIEAAFPGLLGCVLGLAGRPGAVDAGGAADAGVRPAGG